VAYSQIEFVGEERADWRNAMLLATIRNLMRSGNEEPYRPERFMPFWDQAAMAREDEARLAAKVREGLRSAARTTPKARNDDGLSG
jgi:hypothetical protein